MVLHLLLLAACVLLCALGNRWAGGLLSKWVGKDLGDTSVRILWGLTTIVPIAVEWHSFRWTQWWVVFILLAGGVVQGLLRGFGWGSSISMGFVNRHPTARTWTTAIVMFTHSLMMNIGVWLTAAILMSVFPLYAVSGLLATALGWTLWYFVAWMLPWNVPFLGMYKTDPPPTAEFLCGGWTGLLIFLYCWFC